MRNEEKENLEHLTRRAGLYFEEYRLDDGDEMRYRFFRTPPSNDMLEGALFVAIGIDEAIAFILGVNIGLEEARRRIMKELDIE